MRERSNVKHTARKTFLPKIPSTKPRHANQTPVYTRAYIKLNAEKAITGNRIQKIERIKKKRYIQPARAARGVDEPAARARSVYVYAWRIAIAEEATD